MLERTCSTCSGEGTLTTKRAAEDSNKENRQQPPTASRKPGWSQTVPEQVQALQTDIEAMQAKQAQYLLEQTQHQAALNRLPGQGEEQDLRSAVIQQLQLQLNRLDVLLQRKQHSLKRYQTPQPPQA
ncbi:hypothetical protein WJX72_002319 [[Myrmecia] bisecta]|uniref:Uncharacterized protein n=1 Tax=[Myrmecia] bisecta TaxID=41462 RepID=A0AAW1QEE8_9CHLO